MILLKTILDQLPKNAWNTSMKYCCMSRTLCHFPHQKRQPLQGAYKNFSQNILDIFAAYNEAIETCNTCVKIFGRHPVQNCIFLGTFLPKSLDYRGSVSHLVRLVYLRKGFIDVFLRYTYLFLIKVVKFRSFQKKKLN